MLRRKRSGFTLVELLVVIAIIGILIGMLLSAVQQVREAARRAACQNNMRQASLAALNYESAHQHLPAGNAYPNNANDPDGRRFGNSFWVLLLPFLEQGNLADQYVIEAGGWTGSSPGNVNRGLLEGSLLPWLRCPSTDLPDFPVDYTGAPQDSFAGLENTGLRAVGMSPCYTGIAGSTNHPTAREVAANNNSIHSFGGVLLHPDTGQFENPVDLGAIFDGTSNTILLGEQSDWLLNDSGVRVDGRSDGNHGFSIGARDNRDDVMFCLTAVRHEINEKSITSAIGSAGNIGNNRPIQSTHPGGAHVAACDGSIHFLTEGTNLDILFAFADKDDGVSVNITE